MLKNKPEIDFLLKIGDIVQSTVSEELKKQLDDRIAVAFEGEDDVIFEIDKSVEENILPIIEKGAEAIGGVELIAEGMYDKNNPTIYPAGSAPKWKLIVDPIDGTRGIMYDKRSAFFIAGLAFNNGDESTLRDIQFAVLVELPTSKGMFSDRFWAERGTGWGKERKNIFTSEIHELSAQPSNAKNLTGGFSQIARFFPPGKALMAQIEEDLYSAILSDKDAKNAMVFEDQYISSGGQLFELLSGHDRFTADIRGLLSVKLKAEGVDFGLTCHPYDVAAHLIGEEAGLIIVDEKGESLNNKLDTTSPVNWLGFANQEIHDLVWNDLLQIISKNGLL